MNEQGKGGSKHARVPGPIPVPEVETLEKEIRRVGRRLLLPQPLRHVDSAGRCISLETRICRERSDRSQMKPATILDVSIGGVAVETQKSLNPGDTAVVFALDETGEVVFGERFRVCHAHKEQAPVPGGQAVRMYGMSSLSKGHSLLYKSFLDTIFLAEYAAQSASVESDQMPWQAVPEREPPVGQQLPEVSELPVEECATPQKPLPRPKPKLGGPTTDRPPRR